MSNYFENFPKVLYKFGSNERPVLFQKLSKYVDVVDTLKDRASAYLEYEIRDYERPDTLAYRLYGKSEYDWTFFLMNDRLRECGWPMPTQELYEYATTEVYTGYVARLEATNMGDVAQYANIIKVGSSVIFTGGATATVTQVDLENAQVYLSSDTDITTNIALNMLVDNTVNTIVTGVVEAYNADHHYLNEDDEWLDYFSTDPTKFPVTNLEHLVNENDATKRIRVIKKESIESIVSEFKRLVASN